MPANLCREAVPIRTASGARRFDTGWLLSARARNLMLVLSLLLTAVGWFASTRLVESRAQDRFSDLAGDIHAAIVRRLRDYEQVLNQTAATIRIQGVPNRAQWQRYYEEIDFARFFPGTKSFGWSLAIRQEELQAHIESVRAGGIAEYSVYPDTNRDLRFSLVYMAPVESHGERALGFDMSSDETRRAAMVRAIDSGLPTLTSSVTLQTESQGNRQPAILFLFPVFEDPLNATADPESLSDLAVTPRSRYLIGFAALSLRTPELIDGILGKQFAGLRIDISEAGQGEHGTVLYTRSPMRTASATTFDSEKMLQLYGQQWHVWVQADRRAFMGAESTFPILITLGNLLLYLSLFGMMRMAAARMAATRRANHAARRSTQSEKRLRAVIEATKTGFLGLDGDGVITLANGAAHKVLGRDAGSLIGHSLFGLLTRGSHPEVDQQVGGAFDAVMAAGDAGPIDIQALREDGSRIPIEFRLSRIDSDDSPAEVLASLVDVSERVAQISERDQTLSKLSRSNEALERYAHAVSHDLKTPIRAIDNLANWIIEDIGDGLPAGSKRHLTTLKQRITRLDKMLDDMLQCSKLSGVDTDIEDIDLADTVHDALQTLSLPPAFDVAVAIDADSRRIRCGRAAMFHILLNLVSNAMKHHHRATGHIRISGNRRGAQVRLTVEDDGPGIPAVHRREVFQAYVTLRPRDEVEGSGMGLTVVQRLIEKIGGGVAIEDSALGGAAIVLTIPDQHAPTGGTRPDGESRPTPSTAVAIA